jgi:hypothetical protein
MPAQSAPSEKSSSCFRSDRNRSARGGAPNVASRLPPVKRALEETGAPELQSTWPLRSVRRYGPAWPLRRASCRHIGHGELRSTG